MRDSYRYRCDEGIVAAPPTCLVNGYTASWKGDLSFHLLFIGFFFSLLLFPLFFSGFVSSFSPLVLPTTHSRYLHSWSAVLLRSRSCLTALSLLHRVFPRFTSHISLSYIYLRKSCEAPIVHPHPYVYTYICLERYTRSALSLSVSIELCRCTSTSLSRCVQSAHASTHQRGRLPRAKCLANACVLLMACLKCQRARSPNSMSTLSTSRPASPVH